VSSSGDDHYHYETLTEEDRAVLMRARLRAVEAEHFKLCMEVRLAGAVGDADKFNPVAQVELAALEVRAGVLKDWLGQQEHTDA
jgi:hypothetical protein